MMAQIIGLKKTIGLEEKNQLSSGKTFKKVCKEQKNPSGKTTSSTATFFPII